MLCVERGSVANGAECGVGDAICDGAEGREVVVDDEAGRCVGRVGVAHHVVGLRVGGRFVITPDGY